MEFTVASRLINTAFTGLKMLRFSRSNTNPYDYFVNLVEGSVFASRYKEIRQEFNIFGVNHKAKCIPGCNTKIGSLASFVRHVKFTNIHRIQYEMALAQK